MLFTKRALVLLFSTVIFLTTFSPVRADDSLTPQVKNPMNEIGFYKDHVYDFKDIVAVDQLSGSANITIPIGSMKGKGVGAFTLSLQYKASASIRIMNAVYHEPGETVGDWDWRLINSYDESNALSSSELAWHITIPSLDQWEAPTQSIVEPHIYKFNLNNVQYKTMNFVDEQGLNQTLLEVGDDMPMKTGCYMARDSSAKSAAFALADIDDDHEEGNYSGKIFKVGGISYTGLDNTNLLGGFFGDLMLFVNGTPEPEPTTQPSPATGLTDIAFTVTKTDPEGNQLKIESKGINTDGHYEEIDYSNNTSRTIQLTGSDGAVSTVTSPGMGTTTFGYINVWVNSGYQRFLKSITFEDGSSYQFEYYFIHDAGSNHYVYSHPTFPTPDLNEGNAFINSFGYENVVHETVNKELYIPMLKSIKLPTGGSIEFKYQVFGCTSDVNGSEVDYHIRLGMKELIFKDARAAVVEKREYSVFVPVGGVPGPAKSTNDFLTDLKSKMVDSTKSLVYPAITNGFGRRILVRDGADVPISLTDQIYTAKLGSSAPYIDREARIKQVYTYANPNDALTAVNSGSGVSGLDRTVTDNEYRMKLASLPAFSDQPGFYAFKFYLVNSVTKKYEGSPTAQLVSTTTKTTQYKGLDNDGTAEESDYQYHNVETKGLVVPEHSETTVSDGSGTTLLNTVTENQYAFPSTLWMAQNLASMQTEGSEKWLSTNSYGADDVCPWRILSSESGPGSEDGNGDWVFTNPKYTVTNTFFDDTARKGLVESRTLNLIGGTGTPSSVTEHFDYTAGILTSYTLGESTGLHLTTTRTIDTTTGLVQAQTNPDGTSVEYTWDSSNRLTGIHPKGGDGSSLTATSITYTNYDGTTMANVAVSGPKAAKYYYDGLGRLTYEGVGTYNGKFDWSRVHYDSLERADKNWTGLRLASGVSPWTGNWNTVASTEHTFDGYGRETKTKIYTSGSTLESETGLAYSGFTKTETLKDKTGAINRVRKFISDAKGNLKELWIGNGTDPLVKKMEYTYTPLFNKLDTVQVNDESGASFQTRSFSYDSVGNLSASITPEEGVITYAGYNLFGKPKTKTHSDKIITFTYDALGRELTRQQQGDASSIITTIWGKTALTIDNGKIDHVETGTTTNGSLTTFHYDAVTGQPADRIDTIYVNGETVEKTVNYHYKPLTTLLDIITLPKETISGLANASRTLNITYGDNQYPKKLTLTFTGSSYNYTNDLVSHARYKATGGTNYDTGDGLHTQYTNDKLGRLTELSHGNVLDFSSYTYDVRGNITSVNMSEPDAAAGTTRHLSYTYSYDIYNRLTGADYLQDINGYNQAAWSEGFAYDPVGNMTAKSFTNTSTLTFGPVQTFGGKTYNKNQDPSMTYDAYGNVTDLTVPGKASALSLAYNPFNQVTSVSEGTNKYEYTYDGEGKRVVKKIFDNDVLTEIHIYIRGTTGKILEELKKVKKPDDTWPTDWTWVKDYYYFGDKLISAASAE